MKEKTPAATVASALLLAVLTLSVFLVSRGRGPQSTLTRYHQTLLEGRSSQLAEFYSAPRGPSAAYLEQLVRGLAATSRRISFGRIVTRGNNALADVVYDSAAAGLRPMRFVFRRSPEGWSIDPEETLAQSRESSIF